MARKIQYGELSTSQASAFREILNLESGYSDWLTKEKARSILQIALRSSSTEHAHLASALFTILKQFNEQRVAAKPLSSEISAHIVPDLIRALAVAGRDIDAITLCVESGELHKQPLVPWKRLLESYRDTTNLVGFLKARDFMNTHRLIPDIDILNMQLELLNTNKLYQDAHTLYSDILVERGDIPNEITRLLMLDTYMNASSQSDAKAFAPDCDVLGEAIYARLRNDTPIETRKVLPKLLSWIVYRQEGLENVQAQVRTMEASGLDLDIEIVNSMLLAATVSKQWLFVETLWNSLQRDGLFPTERTFSLRIEASVMAGKQTFAKTIFEQSKSAGFADMIDPVALQTLLAAEILSGNSDELMCSYILQLLEKIQPFPITPTTLKILIPKLLETKEHARIERILELSGTRADWNTEQVIKIIIDQVPHTNDIDSVLNIFVLMRNCFWNEPLYNLTAREALLRQAIKMQSGQRATQMFTQYLTSQIKPDEQTYNMMLKGGIELGDFGMIRKLHQCMKMDMNLSTHTSILNTLMLAYSHLSSTLAFDVWEQISRSGRGPSQASVSIVLDTCTYSRVPIKGQHIWRILERSKFRFNDNNYASYVEMLNKHNMTSEAVSVLTSALAEKKAVGPRAVSTLYNTAADKEMIAQWALDQCPAIWHSIPRK